MASERTDPAATDVLDMSTDGPTEATTAGESQPDAGARQGAVGRTARRLRHPRVLLALLLVVALIAASATLVTSVLHARHLDRLRAEAVDTARDYSVALSSFDFQSLDANRDKIAQMSTPGFADKYNQMVDALRQIVTDGKGQATATADHVAVESIDDSNAVVLAFVDQHAKNVVSPDGNSQKYRMVVTLVRDGDRWVVDNVDTK
ncbi:mce associated protein mas1a [Rhodococcus spelaei]|uniref:mce associated protein mas1a n=1 Tax=Rhodococcus spelaei TaxID=2546320 RepID=UPI001FE446D2|nr:mce associated protein mas1a [Rhodococcus spelaei]